MVSMLWLAGFALAVGLAWAVGFLTRRPELGLLGVGALVLYTVQAGPIMDSLRPATCRGQSNCPDPPSNVFAYGLIWAGILCITLSIVVGAYVRRRRDSW